MALEVSIERDGNAVYQQKESDDDLYVDWRGKESNPKKHGGIRAAALSCVVGVLINMVFLSNCINTVSYFQFSMHYTPATSATMVTNFMGTAFILSLLGGYIGDAVLTRFTTFIIFCAINLLGLILLAIQAQYPKLQPDGNSRPSLSQAAILNIGLYAFAIGIAGLNVALPAHGADQLDHKNQRLISAYFNWFNFAICLGYFLSATFMVWVQENKGWNWSFMITIVVLCLSFVIFVIGTPIYRYQSPSGSPLARMIKVLFYAARNRKASPDDRTAINPNKADGQSYGKLRNRTDVAQVEETRTFLGLLPIFASTIMTSCCIAQLDSFSVVQGSKMNRKLHNFVLPTQVLSVPSLCFMIAVIPLSERFQNNGFMSRPLQKLGVGLALASGSMAVAALVEAKRREAAHKNVTLSVFWLVWQFLLLGVSDQLALSGMLEFFYSKAPVGMRSLCTALSWCSLSLGYFLNSLLVPLANSLSGRFGREWLGGYDLNRTRLDLFYTLLCILNSLSFLNYLYWAKRF